MRLRLIIAVVVVLTAVSVSDAFAGSRYRTYTSCGRGPDNSCVVGDAWGGFFKDSHGKKTHYRLCVNPPQGASKQCRKLQTDRKGKNYATVAGWFGNEPLGTYKFTWKKGGHKIDRDAMVLHIGD
jgi:hypothetical protein